MTVDNQPMESDNRPNITDEESQSSGNPSSNPLPSPSSTPGGSISTIDIQEAVARLILQDETLAQRILTTINQDKDNKGSPTVKETVIQTDPGRKSDPGGIVFHKDVEAHSDDPTRMLNVRRSQFRQDVANTNQQLGKGYSFFDQSSINLSFDKEHGKIDTPKAGNKQEQHQFDASFDDDGLALMKKRFPGLNPDKRARSLKSDITTEGSLTRNMRNDLKGKDLATFIEKAIAPLGIKFDLPLTSQSDPSISTTTLLDSTYSFVSKVEHLLLRIKNFCMDDVFMIVETSPSEYMLDKEDVVIDTTVEPIDLLSNYSKLDADKVKRSCQAYFQYGDNVAIDNLMWSQNLILRSCSEALYNTLSARLSILPPYQRGDQQHLCYWPILCYLQRTKQATTFSTNFSMSSSPTTMKT
jgi:hypothetical protein